MGSPHKPTLEVDADLVERALNIVISIPESFMTSFTQPTVVVLTNSWCGFAKFNKSWFLSMDLHGWNFMFFTF